MSERLNPFDKFQNLKSIQVTNEILLKKELEELLSMNIETTDQFLVFQERRDLIEKHIINEFSESYFLMTTDIANEDKKKRKEHYEQVINPMMREYDDKLNRKFLASTIPLSLGSEYEILRRNKKMSWSYTVKKILS